MHPRFMTSPATGIERDGLATARLTKTA